jgi:hypothetical protein
MSQYLGSERARIEQAQRREAFRQNSQSNAFRKWMSSTAKSKSGYSEFRMRRLAPFALLFHFFSILFFISWIVSNSKTVVDRFAIGMETSHMTKIAVPEDKALYWFDLTQNFSNAQPPIYSELEVEILDENYDHVYSVYKDLWQERHSDGEGGSQVYSDTRIQFEVELPKAGDYYVRIFSYNKNYGSIIGTISKHNSGGLYFGFFAILFGTISVIFFFGAEAWGSPFTMYRALSKIKNIRKNRLFFIFLTTFCVIYVISLIVAITHYGYAAGGDKTILPSFFHLKHSVIYLG